MCDVVIYGILTCFFFQAEDGIRDLVRSRGLGDVYKRQPFASGIFVGFGQRRVGVDGAQDLVQTQAVLHGQHLSLIHI